MALEVELQMMGVEVLPKDTFVSMRVGDSQKQSRLQSSRVFKFAPGAADTRGPFGRIEVFKRVGHATVGLNDGQEVKVECADSDLEGLRFNVKTSGVGGAPLLMKDPTSTVTSPKSQAAKERVDEARRYLEDHKLEELIASAMREIIRVRPAEPREFLCEHIRGTAAEPPVPPKPKKAAGAQLTCKRCSLTLAPCKADASEEVAALKKQCKDVLLGAAESGKLAEALNAQNKEASETEALKQQCKAVLLNAAESGALQALAQGKKVEEKVMSTEDLRLEAKAVIFKAASNGQLARALSMQKVEDTPSEKPPYKLMPSVGSWLAPKPPMPAPVLAASASTKEAAAPEPEKFPLKPSVGTWLAPKPKIEARPAPEEPAPSRPFVLQPSVGTWLARKPAPTGPPKETASSPSAAPPAVPLFHKPSAGWLMSKPYQVEKPWYYKAPSTAEGASKQDIIQLQDEIAKRDHQLEELRAQLSTLRDAVGESKLVELGLS